MANTVVENLSDKVKEEIAPGVRESLPATDGIFGRINDSSMGVVRDTGIGRDYYVKHNFTASLAGAYYWRANPFGSTMLSSVLPSQVMNAIHAFPGADEAGNMGIVQRRLQLVQGTGNFFLPIQLMGLDALSASTFKYVGLNIRQVAKLIAHMNATNFYAVHPSATTLNPLALVTVVDTNGTTGDSDVTVDLSTATIGRIRNLYPGMFVDVLDQSNSYASLVPGTDYAVVTEADYINKKAKIVLTAGGNWAQNLAAADAIIAKGCGAASVGYGPSGLEDWIKEPSAGSNVTVFNIYLSTAGTDVLYPQFGSLIAAVSGPLTEEELNKYVGSFIDAYGMKLDSMITTGGVVREMLNQADDLGVFQRQGAALDMELGWSKLGYRYQGKEFDWLLSTYCTPGYLYGIKTGEGNLTRYIPPRIPSAGTSGEFDGEVQFIAEIGGSTGIFKPLHNSSGQTTEVVEAPFVTLHENAPTDVQSIKLTGLTESNA